MSRFDGVVRSVVVLGVVACLPAARAAAQTTPITTNKDLVYTLFFVPSIAGLENPATVDSIAKASANGVAKLVSTALSTTPVASSSAGFSYYTDQATGQRRRKSQSFGPTFADRPLTNGKGVFNFGFNYQYSQTNFAGALGTADGRNVGLPIFDNFVTFKNDGLVQYITRRAFLETSSQAFNVLFSYGVTDRLDVGFLLPLVSMSLTGRVDEAWSLTRTWTPADNHPTPAGTWDCSATTEGCPVGNSSISHSAGGIGDVAFRLKYWLGGQTGEGVAVAADVRMPTGSEENLLGAGKASVKIQALLLKSGLGPASIHANVGYTAGGESNAINFVAGADAALLSRKQLTASVSFLGRTLTSASLPSPVSTSHADAGTAFIDVNRFSWQPQTLSLLQLAAGIKLQLGGQWLLDATVLLPLNQHGYQPGVSPVIGIERTWGK